MREWDPAEVIRTDTEGEVIKDLMLEAEECMIRIEGDLSWDIYVLCYVSLYYISPY